MRDERDPMGLVGLSIGPRNGATNRRTCRKQDTAGNVPVSGQADCRPCQYDKAAMLAAGVNVP